MSTQTVVTCDRCGSECKNGDRYHFGVRHYVTGQGIETAEIDLCPFCYAWLMNPPPRWRKYPAFRPLLPLTRNEHWPVNYGG